MKKFVIVKITDEQTRVKSALPKKSQPRLQI